MKTPTVILAGLLCSIDAHVPSLAEVAASMGDIQWNTDYAQLWTDSKGEALTESALATRDRDQIRAAMLLGGKVMSMGVSLPVETNGLSALCEVVLSNREEFFSDTVFIEQKRAFMATGEACVYDYRIRLQLESEVFPLLALPHVCGRNLPLSVKAALVKARSFTRSMCRLNSPGNNLELHYAILSLQNSLPSLNQSFKQLYLARDGNGHDYGRSKLLLAVDQELYDSPADVSNWLRTVIQEMLTSSKFFKLNGVYKLQRSNDPYAGYAYYVIGLLLGLAIKNSVAIPGVTFEQRLLRVMTLSPTNERTDGLAAHVQRLRSGFNSVITLEAVSGSPLNPQVNLINEHELGIILSGQY